METLKHKIDALLSKYHLDYDNNDIENKVAHVIDHKVKENFTIDNLKTIFSCIDLTSLNTTDNDVSITEFTKKVNAFNKYFPEMPNVGAICVYPSLVNVVKHHLHVPEVAIASVAAGFPSSQTFIEVKIAETGLAVFDGANEIDIVISVGEFLSKNYSKIFEDISEIKAACNNAKLKVILETGALIDATKINVASILAMEAGADFIKTSTGKMNPAATPQAVYVMLLAIKQFYQKYKVKIGIKPAGGIVTTHDALIYYTLVKEVLGNEWLNNSLFRIGASRLANNLIHDIRKLEGLDEVENYF